MVHPEAQPLLALSLEGLEEAKNKIQQKLPVGSEFSFLWKVKDETAKLEDVKIENLDALKSLLEGDYVKK